MAKIITVAAQKGGSGKTATVSAIGAALREKGRRILFVDMDAQANLTAGICGPDEVTGGGVADLLTGRAAAEAVTIHTDQGDVIPATDKLIDMQLNKAAALREALAPVRRGYDYILIDSGPTLSVNTINAIMAADFLIVPVRAEFYTLGTLRQLHDLIKATKTHGNPDLTVAGILITQFKGRTTINRQMAETIEKTAALMNTRVFGRCIRDGIAVAEAPAMRKSLLQYAPKSGPADDYRAAAAELLTITEKEAGR